MTSLLEKRNKDVKVKQKSLNHSKEIFLWNKGFKIVAGVDEAGRGPLAGPVVAASCVISPNVYIEGIYDSKSINSETRERLYSEITGHPDVHFKIVEIDETTIDAINILQATFLAMTRAIDGLPVKPNHVMIDGPYIPPLLKENTAFTSEAIVKGDQKVFSIACASLLAKVHRDRIMMKAQILYPFYGFSEHKGYPTKKHLSALKKYGVCQIHRRSFGPVRAILEVSSDSFDTKGVKHKRKYPLLKKRSKKSK